MIQKNIGRSGVRIKNMNDNKKIEIGILEIQRHIPILYTFSKICKTKNTNITIFTTKKLFQRLEAYLENKKQHYFDLVLKNKWESNYSYLRRVQQICNQKIDLLFVNTIHETTLDLINYLGFNPKSKKILTIHHANAWFKPHLVLNIKNMIRTIDTNLSSALISKFILPKFDAINVIYPPLKDYIKKTGYNREIFTLPTSIYENNSSGSLHKKTTYYGDKKLCIVIPGLIQRHRKNLDGIPMVFEKLFRRYDKKLELHILGMPIGRYGKKIQEEFKKIREKGHSITLYKHFIPDKIFDETLMKSDIILAPIRIKTRADNEITETYGITVGSGIVYNAVRYARPIIVPAEFNMISELKTSTLTYNSLEELTHILEDLITNPQKLKLLKEEALKNSKKFSLQKMQQYFEKNILTWFKTTT
ncbi:MAG: hypothetical protein DRN05_05185 [Thermoplasmata archaeon]|nr:MAG: hypothetical protein DRN05_05185 [Thermoplasmata archaeon]